jgi:hypothetical protein
MADTRPQYRVTGAYVTLKTATPAGPRMIGFQFGAIVPADVPQDQIDHHLRVRLIAPIDAPAEPAAKSRKTAAGG